MTGCPIKFSKLKIIYHTHTHSEETETDWKEDRKQERKFNGDIWLPILYLLICFTERENRYNSVWC